MLCCVNDKIAAFSTLGPESAAANQGPQVLVSVKQLAPAGEAKLVVESPKPLPGYCSFVSASVLDDFYAVR